MLNLVEHASAMLVQIVPLPDLVQLSLCVCASLPAGPIVASVSNHSVLNLVEHASAMLVQIMPLPDLVQHWCNIGPILVQYAGTAYVFASLQASAIGAGVSNLPGTRAGASAI